jgi:hypothetical protein
LRPIQLQIRAGNSTGKRLLFQESPITFGRDGDNHLVVDLPTVSRHHGELQCDADRWFLVNLSANGTQLGKNRVTGKRRELSDGQVVSIGDQAVFEISLGPAVSGSAEVEPGAQPGAGTDGQGAEVSGNALSGRAKLWIGIGVYLLVMLGGVIFFSTLDRDGQGDGLQGLGRLTIAHIRDDLASSLDRRVPDARQLKANLDDAVEQLALEGSEPDALYRAHQAYQRAASFLGQSDFANPLHQRQSLEVEQRLAEQIMHRYQRALDLGQSGQMHEASDAYAGLLAFYPAPTDSVVVQNVQEHWAEVRKHMGKRKWR